MANPLDGLLNTNFRKRDIAAAWSGADALGLLQPAKMQRMTGGERDRLLQAGGSIPAAPGPFNGLLNFPVGTPSANEPNRAVPGTSAVQEEVANTRTPVWRVLHAPSKHSTADLPGKHEAVFLKRSRTSDLVSVPSGSEQYVRQNKERNKPNFDHHDSIGLGMGRTDLINVHPCMALNPIAWTEAMHDMLNKLAAKKYAEYAALDMRRVFGGHSGHDWTGWTFDGVVRVEQDSTRNSSAFADGYRNTGLAGGRFMSPPDAGTKLATIITTGEQEMVDYFGGRGLVEGASLFFVVKMYRPTAGAKAITYVKSCKAIVLGMNAENTVKTQPVQTLKVGGNDVTQMVPGIFPVALPDGGELDPIYAAYENEEGVQCVGTILYAGRVMFLPARFQGKPALTGPDDANFLPLLDAREYMTRDHLTVLLPNFKDGSLMG